MKHRPVALIVMDGFGYREMKEGNAILHANTPNLDQYWNQYPHGLLGASGMSVGLPEGQMGNSEVGHLNLGAGRIVYQEFTRISKSIADGDFFRNEVLLKAIQHVKKHRSRLHLYGLLSDGGVHSHQEHLYALLQLCKQEGINEIYVHAFLDGRDVAPDSAKGYIKELEAKMVQLGVGQMATIHGRYYAMDRDHRWERVEKSYRALVDGEGVKAHDPVAAVDQSYAKGIYDEFVLPTVLVDENEKPKATIQDHDAIIAFNFRPDRMIQLSLAFTQAEFSGFERGPKAPRDLFYATFTKYSETIDAMIAYPPIGLHHTFGEIISSHGLRQLRIAETEKYPHVTFFFNGGQEQPFPGEKRVLIDSPKVATYDLKPEMSAYEVTDAVIHEIETATPDVIILNFANCDMVGHTGQMEATIKAVETVDHCLGRVVEALQKAGGIALITADHGNADYMVDEAGQTVTSHSTSPVPLIVTDQRYQLREGGVLADLAPTMLWLLELEQPEEMTGSPIIVGEAR
ncbi:2,3-bisphosphoglycerate-independent phosphoglycerate mutase [Rubeoparvulum massiliense]|uniref:2,3-bisphosphoglycerate-independent phosphoglycerate mutase n=1 Tax=Rubeoparvulum massiliense TaxID=1631346 RepID=UPI000AD8FC06|nr:2,3-bisphosphoglycerate-independent phosphoglycerate mutase [Rubeoparvulum massiliense]